MISLLAQHDDGSWKRVTPTLEVEFRTLEAAVAWLGPRLFLPEFRQFSRFAAMEEGRAKAFINDPLTVNHVLVELHVRPGESV